MPSFVKVVPELVASGGPGLIEVYRLEEVHDALWGWGLRLLGRPADGGSRYATSVSCRELSVPGRLRHLLAQASPRHRKPTSKRCADSSEKNDAVAGETAGQSFSVLRVSDGLHGQLYFPSTSRPEPGDRVGLEV